MTNVAKIKDQIAGFEANLDATKRQVAEFEEIKQRILKDLDEAQADLGEARSRQFAQERVVRALQAELERADALAEEKAAAVSENPDRPLYEDLPAYEDVVKAYNGRPGCACGCMGTYVVPSEEVRQRLNDASTWEPYGIEDVRPRACKMRFKKVMEAAAKYMHKCESKTTLMGDVWEYTDNKWGVFFSYVPGNYMCVEDETTVNTIYFD